MVGRVRFLEDLVRVATKHSLKGSLSVNFTNEQGIDAGGLRREFYELIGKEMKNTRYNLFQNYFVNSVERYFLHPSIYEIERRRDYLYTLGKFTANSIVTRNYIGICFVDAFVKHLYDEPVTFEDMQHVVSPVEYAGYMHLKELSAEELEDACITFEIVEQSKRVELLPGGRDMPVTRDNLAQYLARIADYRLHSRYRDEILEFKRGFNEILKVEFIRQFIVESEFNILICGKMDINAENILAVCVYSNGNAPLISMFKTYVQEAEEEVLKCFLKFATGSSVIPFDTDGYRLEIQFINSNIKNLPLAHTCFRSIECPKYTSQRMMKIKLDAAFLYGSEGFSFG